ncbi:flagellar basal-body MS-ring/collar protein FliF [Mariprofundus sp. KV]|uniref:flagellar basal-body MS-ring/collar protein FliF n=1 Tax=Mariprofundus sp. KV TaxID=2608715 RepID=UPI00159F839B|nr:flagellar basal-body MS-ring/collar protein FliF [Mariprofundus sp. KV]NWF37316.1 flagellar M-ring protein FliF [Mariprofundus sp. KV]
MADSLMPQTPMNMANTPIDAASHEAGAAAQGATIQVPQVLAKYRKILLFAAASLMLTGFLGLVLWSSEKPYRAIYAGMAEKDAASVVEMLQKEHIPYRLEGGGTVMVPEDQVYQVRLNLAGQGVTPTGKTGFEIFDQSNEFGLSDFTRKINLQRALQGELARTIEVMPQVSAARVHLVLPKESAFADRDRKATASVMLQLSGGQRLPKRSVIAIQNLVAASVPEMDQSDVTVVDASGSLLSANEKEAPMSEGQTLQEYQGKLEQRMEERLTGMLEQIVGVSQAVVRVSADINREFIEQKNTRYNPDEQVLRSRKSISENRQSNEGAALGVPGLASNTPGANPATGVAAAQPSDSASRNEDVNNYEISTINEHRIVPFGSINKLSVAVIVGGASQSGENGEASFTPRSKEELASIQALVERAMGYNEDRGDSVDVQSMPLMDISSVADSEALASSENRVFYMQIVRYSLAGLALLLLGWFVLRPLAKRIQESADQQQTAKKRPEGVLGQHELSGEAYARLANMEQVRQSVVTEPDRANKVLREWVDPV